MAPITLEASCYCRLGKSRGLLFLLGERPKFMADDVRNQAPYHSSGSSESSIAIAWVLDGLLCILGGCACCVL